MKFVDPSVKPVFIFENYVITQDVCNYVINSTRVIGSGESRFKAKAENIGKVSVKPIKYSSTFLGALKMLRDLLIFNIEAENNINYHIQTIQDIDRAFINTLETTLSK